MWKSLEERNLAIIEVIMQELGVSDIEELPAKVHELKEAAEQSGAGDGAIPCANCTQPESNHPNKMCDVFCPPRN